MWWCWPDLGGPTPNDGRHRWTRASSFVSAHSLAHAHILHKCVPALRSSFVRPAVGRRMSKCEAHDWACCRLVSRVRLLPSAAAAAPILYTARFVRRKMLIVNRFLLCRVPGERHLPVLHAAQLARAAHRRTRNGGQLDVAQQRQLDSHRRLRSVAGGRRRRAGGGRVACGLPPRRIRRPPRTASETECDRNRDSKDRECVS